MRIVRRGDWWNFNLVVPGVLRREFSEPGARSGGRGHQQGAVLHAVVDAGAGSRRSCRTCSARTAFREAPPPVALYVVALEALIPRAYRRAPLPGDLGEHARRPGRAAASPRERITVVHCGLDHDALPPRPGGRRRARGRRSLYVGRLRRYKGVDWVMRALPRGAARACPTRGCVVIGDGPYRAASSEPRRRGSASRDAVEFLGFLPARGEGAAHARGVGAGAALAQGGLGAHRGRGRRLRHRGGGRRQPRAARLGAARRDRTAGALRRRRARWPTRWPACSPTPRCASGSRAAGVEWAARFQLAGVRDALARRAARRRARRPAVTARERRVGRGGRCALLAMPSSRSASG